MNKRLLWVAMFLAGSLAGQEGNKIALIIGNDSYLQRPLQNAVNDARAMDKSLREAGFKTILRENATKVMLDSAAAEFVQAIGPNDTALFFYAGHAVQIENENVLIPVDFEAARSVVEARFKSFSLAQIFDYLRTRGKIKIVIIDACRSNPVAEGNALQAGLAIPQTSAKNMYIAYSTSPNHVAQDNPDGRNSWFTEALADAITQPSLTLEEVFTQVRSKVENATRGSQTPWSQNSMTAKFYFHPPSNLAEVAETELSGKWLEDARRNAQRGNWQESISDLNRILKVPSAAVTPQARALMPYVQARHDALLKWEAREYSAAAALFEKAMALDSFAVDAAFASASSHLLLEDLVKAVDSLNAVRKHGTSADARRADVILKELAVIQPEAAKALKDGLPPPPSILEVLADTQFGVPDFKAGLRRTRHTAMDYSSWAKQMPLLKAPVPPVIEAAATRPPDAATVAASQGPFVDLESFHLEVKSEVAARDLVQEADFGELRLSSSRPGASVVVDGKNITKLPVQLKLPPGKYNVKVVERGATLQSKEVEVRSNSSVELIFQ